MGDTAESGHVTKSLSIRLGKYNGPIQYRISIHPFPPKFLSRGAPPCRENSMAAQETESFTVYRELININMPRIILNWTRIFT